MPKRRKSDVPSYMGTKKSKTVCRYFMRGRCLREERCPFAHPSPSTSYDSASSQTNVREAMEYSTNVQSVSSPGQSATLSKVKSENQTKAMEDSTKVQSVSSPGQSARLSKVKSENQRKVSSEKVKSGNEFEGMPLLLTHKSLCFCCQSSALVACTGCKVPYCSPECQRDDWAFHKHKCLQMETLNRENYVAAKTSWKASMQQTASSSDDTDDLQCIESLEETPYFQNVVQTSTNVELPGTVSSEYDVKSTEQDTKDQSKQPASGYILGHGMPQTTTVAPQEPYANLIHFLTQLALPLGGFNPLHGNAAGVPLINMPARSQDKSPPSCTITRPPE